MTFTPTIWKPQKEYSHVTQGEALAIIDACKAPKYRNFVKCLWFTGLRINEVLAIESRHVASGPDGPYLVIMRLKKKQNTHQERLPIPRELFTVLDDYRKAVKLQTSDSLFPGHENTYRYELRQAAKRGGLETWQKIHPHLFRHGFIYAKVKAGVHPLVLTKLVGHSNLGITQGYYSPQESDLREAMER